MRLSFLSVSHYFRENDFVAQPEPYFTLRMNIHFAYESGDESIHHVVCRTKAILTIRGRISRLGQALGNESLRSADCCIRNHTTAQSEPLCSSDGLYVYSVACRGSFVWFIVTAPWNETCITAPG